MTKHIPKKARKGVTRDRARELDVKALARSAGLNFDGVALTSAGLVLLADSAGAAPLTKAPAEHGHPRGGKDQLASSTTSSTTSDGASAATRSPGHDVAAAAAVTKPVALDQSGHPFAGVSGSGTSQSLIDSLIARETEAPLPGDATSTSEASTEAVSGSGTIATSGESLVVGAATATAAAGITATVDLTASTVDEGTGVDYVFTATLSSASHGVTTIHTDQGDITIADGATTGTLVIAANNGEDVYSDASSLTASITGVSGGGFESLVVGTATATANVSRHRHHRQRRPHRLHRR